MKLGAVSFPLTKPNDFKAWESEATRWLREAQTAQVEILVFPEYMTLALESDPQFTSWYDTSFKKIFSTAAAQNNMVILAGTHKRGHNTSALFLPSGDCIEQHKIHLIPSEPDIQPGTELAVVTFKKGKLATAICYDIEFPEYVRPAVKQGANLLLCPSWTEKKDGFHRVRTCALARAIENQLFVVHAPLVGSLREWGVDEVAVGSAAILAPCDPSFPANGVLAEGPMSEAALVVADADFDLLQAVRENGAVRTYRDFLVNRPMTVKEY